MRRDRIWVFFEAALEEPIFHRFAPFIDQIVTGKVRQAERTLAKTVLFLSEALATGVLDGKAIFRFFNALVEFKTDLDVRFSPLMETVIQEGWLGFTDGEPPFGAEGMDVIRAFCRTILDGDEWYALLAHPSVMVRYAMAEILADLGSSADIPFLDRLKFDPDPGLRLRAEPLVCKIRIRESEDRVGAML
ncbi:MAG TPA: HEAT repeat domain-containing protein, partial [Nitrospiria bacterium]|nr:HEAT repeat domain-containing protein [Nitrospiria bacterium]